MLLTRFVGGMLSAGLMVVGTGAECAQTQAYPNKSLRIITGSVGGGNDVLVRLMVPGISASLGQPVIVENRTQAVVAAEVGANAPPDGYTMLFAANSLWLSPLLARAPYAIKNFAAITLVASAPNVLVINPSVAATSVRELIAFAKAKPGVLNFASSGTGSGAHLAGELFKSMAAVNIVHIPFKGAGPAVTGLLGNEAQLYFAGAASAAASIKAGKLRALAVSSAEPSPLAPGLPTVAASGVPGYEAVQIYAILAPAKTPAPVINRLNREIVRILNSADINERFFSYGVKVIASSPEELDSKIKSETVRMGKVIKDAGIRAD